MTTATLTSKGQVTIPKSVRDSLRLHTGDRIEFVVRGGSEAVLKPITLSVDEVFGRLHARASRRLTVAEMDRAVAARLGGRPG
jgi:AbrB family looped-hinge helix DNA binding protein